LNCSSFPHPPLRIAGRVLAWCRTLTPSAEIRSGTVNGIPLCRAITSPTSASARATHRSSRVGTIARPTPSRSRVPPSNPIQKTERALPTEPSSDGFPNDRPAVHGRRTTFREYAGAAGNPGIDVSLALRRLHYSTINSAFSCFCSSSKNSLPPAESRASTSWYSRSA
jgi:hypothetical protein